MSGDYYQILEIPATATLPEIKKSYKKLALRYHPDKIGSWASGDKFIAIQKAYEVLSDPDKKRSYDLTHKPKPARTFEWNFKSNETPQTAQRKYSYETPPRPEPNKSAPNSNSQNNKTNENTRNFKFNDESNSRPFSSRSNTKEDSWDKFSARPNSHTHTHTPEQETRRSDPYSFSFTNSNKEREKYSTRPDYNNNTNNKEKSQSDTFYSNLNKDREKYSARPNPKEKESSQNDPPNFTRPTPTAPPPPQPKPQTRKERETELSTKLRQINADYSYRTINYNLKLSKFNVQRSQDMYDKNLSHVRTLKFYELDLESHENQKLYHEKEKIYYQLQQIQRPYADSWDIKIKNAEAQILVTEGRITEAKNNLERYRREIEKQEKLKTEFEPEKGTKEDKGQHWGFWNKD